MSVSLKIKYYNSYMLKKINRVGISSLYDWYVEEAR